jgi:hypothetical protein
MYCMYMHVFLKDLFVDTYTIHAYTYNTYIYLHTTYTCIYKQIHSITYNTYIYLRTYKYIHWKNVSILQYFWVNTYQYQFHYSNTYQYVRHGSLWSFISIANFVLRVVFSIHKVEIVGQSLFLSQLRAAIHSRTLWTSHTDGVMIHVHERKFFLRILSLYELKLCLVHSG